METHCVRKEAATLLERQSIPAPRSTFVQIVREMGDDGLEPPTFSV
jgi:hypothetical protein